ncbi:MAG: hypothetical protein JOZ05_08925 [Acetobacteraceae bacterium]|nr:hypothetical protein [Acetobacteraceae bacterium]
MPSYDAQSQVLALAEQTGRMLAIANAMVASGRRVDLTGLHHNAGLLCAKSLDLPPSEAGFARAELIRLVGSLDALAASMRERRP